MEQKSNLTNAATNVGSSNLLNRKFKIHPKTNDRFLTKEQIKEKSSSQGYEVGYQQGLKDAEKKYQVKLQNEDELIKNARNLTVAASLSKVIQVYSYP